MGYAWGPWPFEGHVLGGAMYAQAGVRLTSLAGTTRR